MKRVGVLLGILLLLIALPQLSVAVNEKEIADGWYPYISEFSKGDYDYSIRGYNLERQGDESSYEDGRIFIKRVGPDGELKTGIPFGECETTSEFEWCFLNASYENEHVDIDNRGQLQPGIKLRMVEFEYEDELDISRSFSTRDFNLYETSEITLRIKNEGDNPISNITVKEPIPEGFELVKKDESFRYSSDENVLNSKFNLYPDNSWVRSYTLKAIEYVSPETQTQVTYDVPGVSGLTQSARARELRVVSPYKLTHSEFKDAFSKDDRTTFKITLQNNEDESLSIEEIDVNLHPNLKVRSESGFDKMSIGRYSYSGKIPPGEQETVSLDLSLPYTGSYEISYDMTFSVKDKVYHESGTAPLEVVIDGLSCRYEFSEFDPVAGSRLNYTVFVENLGGEPFYAINGSWKDPFGNSETFYRKNVFSGDTLKLASRSVVLPLKLEKENYTFNVDAKYRSDKNEWFECREERVLPVSPVDRYVNVSTSFDPANASRGQEVTATVLVHNLLDTPLQNEVHIAEKNLLNLTFDGQTEAGISRLSADESVQAYSFTFTVPEDISDDSLSFERDVSIGEFGYEDEFTASVAITDPLEEGESLNEKKERIKQDRGKKESSSSDSSNQDGEKKGFIGKLVDLIKSLF
ncbi:MAG: hypothetical protein ACLFTH_03835 [Candidatus Woesearchaeota archaeon]